MIVVSRDEPASIASAALSGIGLRARGAERLRTRSRNHWVLSLLPGLPRQIAARAVERLRASGRFEFVAPAYRDPQGQPVTLVDYFPVRFRDGVTRAQVDSLNRLFGVAVRRPPQPDSGRFEYWLSYPTDSAADPLRVTESYARHGLVQWAEPGMILPFRPQSLPSDPYFTSQWHLRNLVETYNGVPVDINVAPAWDVTLGEGVPSAGGITVAVIDNGIESGHPELSGHVLSGYDAFTDNSCTDQQYAGCAWAPARIDNHGTPIAGIIAAQHDGVGVAGIAPAVWLVPIRIFTGSTFADNTRIADAINFAWYVAHADVLSNSWSGVNNSSVIDNAIANAVTYGRSGRGAVFVASAGNTSNRPFSVTSVNFPARNANAIAVSAISRSGPVPYYSNGGPELDIAAPSGDALGCGGNILTIDLTGADGCSTGSFGDPDYGNFSGTSAAVPQVAAAAALLLSKDPTATQAEIKTYLYQNADYWGSANDFGAGKLNIGRAMNAAVMLRVTITGHAAPSTPGDYTYQAKVRGGLDTPTFQWQVSNNGTSFTNVPGETGSTYTLFINTTIWLRVVVTSGTQQVTSASFRVQGPPSGCPPPKKVC